MWDFTFCNTRLYSATVVLFFKRFWKIVLFRFCYFIFYNSQLCWWLFLFLFYSHIAWLHICVIVKFFGDFAGLIQNFEIWWFWFWLGWFWWTKHWPICFWLFYTFISWSENFIVGHSNWAMNIASICWFVLYCYLVRM